MADDLVKGFDAEGNRVLVPIDKVDELADMGGRVASDQEIAQAKLDDQYAKSSTASKVVGAVIGTNLPPQLRAWQMGGAQGITAGTYHGLVRQAIDEIAGQKAGNTYEQHINDLKTGYSGTFAAGEVAGMVGGAAIGAASGAGAAGVGARLLPSAGVSALGGAVEQGVARALGGVAARGLAGRAVTSAAALGAQGLVEGALYGAGQELGEQMLGDHEVAADRVFAATGMGALYGAAGGAILGGGGSLLKSGAGTVVGGARSGLTRMGQATTDAVSSARTALREGELLGRRTAVEAADAITDAGEGAVRAAKQGAREAAENVAAGGKALADATGTNVAQESASLAKTWGKWKQGDTQKGWAYELFFNQLGAGNGLQSTRFTKLMQRAKLRPNDMGEVAVRRGIFDVNAGVLNAAENSMPDAVLARTKQARTAVGAELGDIYAASGAKIAVGDIDDAYRAVRQEWAKKAGFEHVVAEIDSHRASMLGKLGLADPNLPRSEIKGLKLVASFQDVLEQRQFLDDLVYRETKTLDPKARVGALREFRAELDGMLMHKLDEASSAPGIGDKVRRLKRDFQALSLLEELAEDSAARQTKAATFGLSDTIRSSAGASIGAMVAGPIGAAVGGVAGGVASKVVRERGNAAAAVLLYRMAEMGTITRAMQTVEQQVNRSAKSLIAAGRNVTAPQRPVRNPIQVAQRAQRQIADLTSSPNAVADRVTTLTQGISMSAPTVAGKVASNLTRALAFLNSKLPPQRVVDPLNPNQQRTWTQTEAARFVRYVEAAEDPIGTLQDIEHGKVTPEAVETLRVLTPTLFRDLQVRTLDALAEQIASGKPVTFETRIKLGTLLGIQSDPSLNPKVRAFLQANVAPAAAAMTAGGTMQPTQGPAPKPIQLKTQHSAFDRLAENGPGRR